MGLTQINVTSQFSDASATTLDAAASMNVAAGDVLVGWFKHEGAATTIACGSVSGSPANTFTFDGADYVTHSNLDLNGSFGYRFVAQVDAVVTFRMTLGAARPFRRFFVWQFRPDVGEVISKDGSAVGSGNSTNPTSGTITTTGTDVAAFGGYGEYSLATLSAREINNVAADGSASNSSTSTWYRLLTATMTNAAADATLSGANEWLCTVMAIKSALAAAPLGCDDDGASFQIVQAR